VSITVETTDTGERRTMGSLTARRVIQTKTTMAEPGARMVPSGTDVVEGWFVDFARGCERTESAGEGHATWMATPVGEPMPRLHIVHRGAPERGHPVETTERHTGSDLTFTITTSLVEFSEAPLDDGLFQVPAGYQAALRLRGGGFDPSRSNTLLNRLRSYWQGMTRWLTSSRRP
jgi:hypothetical protein